MLNVAVIGVGGWGRNHARTYRELETEGVVRLLKICDIDEAVARDLSEALGCEYTTDYADVVSDARIQAVNIVTPSLTHYQLAREFLMAEKDVLVEKPMTLDIGDAKALAELDKSTDRILMVGHLFRYHPVVVELRQYMEAGELGKIQSLFGRRLHFTVPRRDMGVAYALGIHELDLFCHLLNVKYPLSLTAVGASWYGSGNEETLFIAMDFGEAKGYALESWLMPGYGKRRDLVVVGTEKSARVDYLNIHELQVLEIRIVTRNAEPLRVEDHGVRKIRVPHAEPLKEELRAFVSHVENRTRPQCDAVIGMRAVVMAEGARQSARLNRPVTFEDDTLRVDL